MTTNQPGRAAQATEVLHALGDPSRRSIIDALRSSPKAVGELAEQLPISRPAISQHLKVLAACGVVTHRSRGTSNVYALNPATLEMLRDYIDVVWRDGLESFQALIEKEQFEKEQS